MRLRPGWWLARGRFTLPHHRRIRVSRGFDPPPPRPPDLLVYGLRVGTVMVGPQNRPLIVTQVAGELGEVLVGQGEGEPVLAGLGEYVIEAVGQVEEVVGLVDIEGRVAAALFGLAGPQGSGLPGLGENEGAEQLAGLLPEF